MRKINIALVTLLVGVIVYGVALAAQDVTITTRQVRNPNELKTWLEANAADAESRLTSGSSTSSLLPLINFDDAGTCAVTLQADKADDAGDKTAIVGTDGAGLAFQTDITSKGTLATKATMGTGGLISTLEGLDAIGAVDLDIGSVDVTDVTVTTDGGTVILDGTVTASDDLTATDDVTAGDDLVVTDDASVGGILGVTGIATFTAESVHNGGIDADSITVDAGAGIDNKSAGTLMVGAVTATKIEVSVSGVETEIQGTLDVHEASDFNEQISVDMDASDEEITITQAAVTGGGDVGLLIINDDRTGATATETDEATITIDAEGVYAIGVSDGAVAIESILDTYAAGALLLGSAIATSVEIADAGVTTDIQGPVTILTTIDTAGASAMTVGVANATSLTLGASDIDTTVAGPLNVLEATGKGIDTTGAGALYLGEAVATSVVIGASDAPTTIAGGLTMAYVAKTTNYTLTASDYTIACTPGAAFVTNTLPDANTVLGKVYNISLLNDGSGDMRVVTDGTDTIADANKVILFEDGGDGCTVQAVGANIWALISNTGGTLE